MIVQWVLRFGLKPRHDFQANGGPAGLKAVSAPYPHLTFYPTGGVSEKNLQETMQNCFFRGERQLRYLFHLISCIFFK